MRFLIQFNDISAWFLPRSSSFHRRGIWHGRESGTSGLRGGGDNRGVDRRAALACLDRSRVASIKSASDMTVSRNGSMLDNLLSRIHLSTHWTDTIVRPACLAASYKSGSSISSIVPFPRMVAIANVACRIGARTPPPVCWFVSRRIQIKLELDRTYYNSVDCRPMGLGVEHIERQGYHLIFAKDSGRIRRRGQSLQDKLLCWETVDVVRIHHGRRTRAASLIRVCPCYVVRCGWGID